MPSTTRRRFLQQSALAAAAVSLPANAHAATITPSTFNPLPLGAIRPTGWLLRQLQIQANGLSGHLGETWPDVGPNSGWLGGAGESWERGPYYLDGLIPLAFQLNDPKLKSIAQPFIDWTLTHQQPSGMIGPASNNDWWPRMVMLKALTQYHEATADPRVLPVLTRYFAHQLQELPTRPLESWGRFRWQDNALSALWLYHRTQDPSLITLVRLLHQQGFDWQQLYARFPYTTPITGAILDAHSKATRPEFSLSTHGVNNGQAIKAAPVWSLVSGVPEDRAAIYTMLAALDRYHGLPNGMFSCDEHLAGRNPSQGSELCTVVETMFSLEQSIAILGDPTLADRLERLAFNALPGAFSPDMWAHQYNQEPNQVECSLHKKPWSTDGPESNLYGLAPHFGCCTANYHQGWPKFTASLFMQIPADPVTGASEGLAAIAYAPCTVHTRIRNTPVECIQTTDYPFRNSIRLTLNPARPIAFPLHLRIPSWATSAGLRINNQPQPKPSSATFVHLHRTWSRGDTIDLILPQTPSLVTGFNNSVSIERGPLVFSLPIGESWVKLRDQHLTADWQVFPSTPWNFALTPASLEQDTATPIPVTEAPIPDNPFTQTPAAAVTLTVTGRQLDTWRAPDGAADPVPPSPVTTTNPERTLHLIPYAAAKLRITAFPTTTKPPSPLAGS